MLTSARYISLLKQFTYMHLKGLVTHFREMALFTILWLTISEIYLIANASMYRSINPQVFLRKGVLNICSKFTGKHPCQSVISIKLLCNFIEITLRHGCSTVNLLHIFRTPKHPFLWAPLDGCFCKYYLSNNDC